MKASPSHKQSGATLILVLGILAILSILVTQLIEDVNVTAHQNRSMKDLRQAYWYALASETIALSKLEELVSKPQLEEKDLSKNFPVDKGVITYHLQPLHTCMNLNSLLNDQAQVEQGQHLKNVWQWYLRQELGLNETDQEKLMHRVKDWIDSDNNPTLGYGAEAPFYSNQLVAQQPINQPLITPVAIQQMEIFPESELSKLLSNLCSRPGDNKLNINPQDLKEENAGVLASLFQGKFNREQVVSLIEQRPKDGYSDLDQFWKQPQLQGLNVQAELKNSISLERRYFELHTLIKLGQSQFGMSSWLFINAENKTRVLARRYGVNP